MRARCNVVALCCLAAGLSAQDADDPVTASDRPTTADLVDALANTSAIFARTAPGLFARETLHQRGRRGLIRILQQTETAQAKKSAVKLPQDFHTHDVISDYALGPVGESRALHEIRSVLTIDGRVISGAE